MSFLDIDRNNKYSYENLIVNNIDNSFLSSDTEKEKEILQDLFNFIDIETTPINLFDSFIHDFLNRLYLKADQQILTDQSTVAMTSRNSTNNEFLLPYSGMKTFDR